MASVPRSSGLFLILTLWVVGACATTGHENAQPPILIRLKPDPYGTSTLELITNAKLEIRHGCIYLVSANGVEDSLAIFPDYYELLFSGGQAIGVRDSHAGRSLKFGVISQFGGNTLKSVWPDLIIGSIPAACGGARAIIHFN